MQFVSVFKYLGHVITNDLSDDNDIKRGMRNMFYHTDLLIRHSYHCSVRVKIMLFRSFEHTVSACMTLLYEKFILQALFVSY